MNCLHLVVLLVCQCSMAYMEKLDGTKLSDQLKKIKDGGGVTHMQTVFDGLQYQPKTGDGDQLLNKIKTNIEDDLKRLTNILLNVQSEVLNQEQKFTQQTTLPMCCDIPQNTLKYDPKFRHEVDFNTACVTRSPISEIDAKYPPKELGDVMKNTYNNDKNILWQHYGTHEGTSVIYPATLWDDCQTYDPRLRPAYTTTASPKDKDLVLVIDSSSSMGQPSGVDNKQKIVIAKEAVNVVIQTLSPNDRVAVLSFDSDVRKASDCYSNALAYATKDNIARFKGFVSSIQTSSGSRKNFEKAIQAAFSYLQTNSTNRDKVILFLSDGMFNMGEDPREVIRDENMKIENEAVTFTYLLKSGEEPEAVTLFQEMASQVRSNGSYGIIREGHFSNFESVNHYKLTIDMASFYLHIQHTLERSIPKFSAPFVDPFSEVGLMTSMCVPVHITSMFHGVACTDIKVGELLKDVEFFEEGKSSYAFLIAQSGRAIAHQLLPDPNYIKIDEDPVQLDISALERSPGSAEILEKMKSGESGNKTLPAVYFTIPRGTLINDGSSNQVLKATYFWTPISNTEFTVAIVLGDESHSEIIEVGLVDDDQQNCFMYHDRSLKSDNHHNCRFHSRLVTLDRSSVKFAPSAFENPFQYIDKDETAVDVTNYEKYFTKRTDNNPGFKPTVRADIWATYKAEQYWKMTKSNHVAWRYIGTKSGILRVYPGISMTKTYDHEKRPWFRQTISHPEMMYITPPYEDAWGSGILITQGQTLDKGNSRQVTAVLGIDFPLQYFNWFIDQIYPSCTSSEYRCIIIDDTGFIVMHPSFKDSTNAEKFQKSIHITEEEPALAKELRKNGVLNRQECQDLSVKKDLRSYRVTMPVGKSTGLNFADTNNQFELTPIPETNIFIIRQIKSSTLTFDCECDKNKQPDFRLCTNCDCLCYNNLEHNVCFNNYSVVGSLPCSARLPDTSGISTSEDLTNLPTCFNPACYTKSSKTECFSEIECGWCEFTFDGFELDQQCCRLKEDCSFGKTLNRNRDTCGGPTITTTGQDGGGKQSGSSDNTDSVIIGGVAAAGGVVITVIIVVVIILVRRNTKTRNPTPYDNPYYLTCISDPGSSADSADVCQNDICKGHPNSGLEIDKPRAPPNSYN